VVRPANIPQRRVARYSLARRVAHREGLPDVAGGGEHPDEHPARVGDGGHAPLIGSEVQPFLLIGRQGFERVGPGGHVPDGRLVRFAREVQAEAATVPGGGGEGGVPDNGGDAQRLVQIFDALPGRAHAAQAGDAVAQPAALAKVPVAPFQQRERRLIPLDRRQPGVGELRPLPRPHQPGNGPPVRRPLEVHRHRIGVGVRLRGEQFADAAMDQPPSRRGDARVDRLAHQRVREADVQPVRGLGQQPRLRRPLHGGEQRLLVHPRQRPQHRQHRLLPDRRRQGEQPLPLPVKPGDAGVDDLPKQGGQRGLAQVAQVPRLPLPPQRAGLAQGAQHLAYKEGVPLGATLDEGDEPLGLGGGEAVAVADEGADGGIVEGPQVDTLGGRLAHQGGKEGGEGMAAGQFVAAIRHDEQQRQRAEIAGHKAEQIEAARVRPVQIVEQEQHGSRGSECREEVEHLPEEFPLAGNFPDGAAHREGIGQRRHLIRLTIAPEEFDPGAIGRRLGEVVAPPDEDQRPPRLGIPAHRLGQRGLADARLAADEHQAAPPGESGIEMLAQDTAFTVASDECGRGTRRWGGAHGVPRVVLAARREHDGHGPAGAR